MNALSVVTDETTTQPVETIFIHGLPVMYTRYGEPQEATYGYEYAHVSGRHVVTLSDGTLVDAYTSELTPVRPLTDAEMITYLTEQLYEASASADSYKKMYCKADDDIQSIATALREEAENRGWCQEYSDFCDQVNSTLNTGIRLESLEQEFEVDIEIEATITAVRTVTVTARSLDDAQTFVQDDPQSFFDVEAEISEAASMGVSEYSVNIV